MNRSSSFPSVVSALFWVGSRPAPVVLRTSLQSALNRSRQGTLSQLSLCVIAQKKKKRIDSKPDGSIWLSRLVPPKKRKYKKKKRKKCCIMPGACRGGSGGGESVCVKELGKKKKQDGELFVEYILFQHLRDVKHIRKILPPSPAPVPPPRTSARVIKTCRRVSAGLETSRESTEIRSL